MDNISSYSGLTLTEGKDYTLTTTYEYAVSTSSKFYEVSKVYTSVPGVYRVTYTVDSLLGDSDQIEASFYVYVVSSDAEIDFATDDAQQPIYSVNVSRDGVTVSGSFTNISGYLYIYATTDTFMDSYMVKKCYPLINLVQMAQKVVSFKNI